MTWYFSEQAYSMPSLRDITTESPPLYNDTFVGQNSYVLPHSLEYPDSASGRYNLQSIPYLSSGGSEALGYCQPQYSSTTSGQHQTYRDNPFVWIGTNNFYPSPSYEQRYIEDSYNLPQRHSYRRHHSNDRSEKSNSRKRRAPTVAQRRAANIRERRRMYNLNEAFDCLRQRIPTFAYEKRLSRIETLRLAISYISFMAGIVNGEDPSTIRINTYDPPMCQAGAAAMTQPCLRHEDSIPASQSCENDDYDDDKDDNDVDDEEDGTENEDDDDDDDDGDYHEIDYDNEEGKCILDANGDVQKGL